MKRLYRPILPLVLALAVGLSACSSDTTYSSSDDYNEAIITAATVGTLYRYLKTTATDGTDSTYRVAVTGSLYPLSIDQNNALIYNVDSLPVGSRVQRTVFTTLSASGYVTIKSIVDGNDTTFVTTDSTDFTRPRELKVTSYSGASTRTYTMELRVHKEEADSFVWRTSLSGAAELQSLSGAISATTAEGALIVFGTQASGAVALRYADGAQTPDVTALPAGFSVGSVVANAAHTAFYALADGALVSSVDALTWSTVPTSTVPDALIAVSDSVVSAIVGGQYASSTDGGATWTPDGADDIAQLPTVNVRGVVVPSRTDSQVEDFVAVGQTAAGETAVARRTVDLSGVNTFDWFAVTPVAESHLRAPALSEPAAALYDGSTVLFGLTADGAAPALYISEDNGRTWSATTLKQPALPAASAPHVAMTVGTDHFIYVVDASTGTVLRGRHNRLGWDAVTQTIERAPRK